MSVTKFFFLVLVGLGLNHSLCCIGPVILLYLQPPSEQIIREIYQKGLPTDKVINIITHTTPHALYLNDIARLIPQVSGFFATYAGYIDYSDLDGRISFPLKDATNEKLSLILTSDIEFIPIEGHTISHTAPNEDRITHYLYERKQDKNNQFYWQVSKQPFSSTQLSQNALILVTEPRNIVVLEGSFMTDKSANFNLPNNIYVVGNDSNIKIALKTLNENRYLEQILYITKILKEKALMQELIKNH